MGTAGSGADPVRDPPESERLSPVTIPEIRKRMGRHRPTRGAPSRLDQAGVGRWNANPRVGASDGAGPSRSRDASWPASAPGALVVTGDPDVGKSALTLRVAEALQADGAAVTSISLRDLPQAPPSSRTSWEVSASMRCWAPEQVALAPTTHS